MISFLRRHRRTLFIAVIVIFLLGTFVGLGGYFFTSRDMSEAVASVGSSKIPYSRFNAQVNNYLDRLRSQNVDVTDDMIKETKVGLMRDMIVDELLLAKAEEMGIVVTDEDLARDIRSTPAFQSNGEFNPQVYYRALRTVFRETPQGYEEMRRRNLKANRLKQLIFQAAKLTPAELSELNAKDRAEAAQDYEKALKVYQEARAKKNPSAETAALAKLSPAEFKDRYFQQRKASVAGRAQQQRALELINFFLRQLATQVEIRTFLEQRESGM